MLSLSREASLTQLPSLPYGRTLQLDPSNETQIHADFWPPATGSPTVMKTGSATMATHPRLHVSGSFTTPPSKPGLQATIHSQLWVLLRSSPTQHTTLTYVSIVVSRSRWQHRDGSDTEGSVAASLNYLFNQCHCLTAGACCRYQTALGNAMVYGRSRPISI